MVQEEDSFEEDECPLDDLDIMNLEDRKFSYMRSMSLKISNNKIYNYEYEIK